MCSDGLCVGMRVGALVWMALGLAVLADTLPADNTCIGGSSQQRRMLPPASAGAADCS